MMDEEDITCLDLERVAVVGDGGSALQVWQGEPFGFGKQASNFAHGLGSRGPKNLEDEQFQFGGMF